MYISHILITALATTSTAQALHPANEAQPSPQPTKRLLASALNWLTSTLNNPPKSASATCPPVWTEIATTLTAQFLADGQCTDAARAAIRTSFHDCFNGACDGSLILAGECSNSENRGLERVCGNLGNLAQQKQVGTADLIQFAAAHAIKTCPGGPTVPVKVGRKDSDVANAQGILPGGHASGVDMVKLFASKGFTPKDLAALLGAHTTARQRTTDPSRANATLDSTPGTWDNKYYQETRSGQAPFTLPVDKSISTTPATAVPFTAFALSKSAWDVAFVSAMQKMSLLGVDKEGLVDCTSALPGGSEKREVRRGSVFERLGW
ncbi:class II peroxidase [Dothidotthia symphoricarpi CBS 119687]|uniref:Peroxidase n=1 Tax=Dothidotthia symphoricarpi CBS 119687 TaxID=1392245 RepID=A0A6A6AAP9_9PLEO|nr:class II peroxidase [Dothidotthia symphoricarpi CBS 119687]KAF2128869.1 class II peroxidase [Dothidotthia symphoricarpi CBS 119687]